MDSPGQVQHSTDPPALRQRTPNASYLRSSSETAETPSTSQVNDKTDVYDLSSELESQPTTSVASTAEETRPSVIEAVDANPEHFSQLISRVRSSTWWCVGAILVVILLGIFKTIFSTARISVIRVTGFLIWLEIVWTAGWLIYLSVWLVGKGWEKVCQTGLKAWEDFLHDTALSQLGFMLSLVAWTVPSWVSL
jgi:hypothetical protein